jgi:hypothetical protein
MKIDDKIFDSRRTRQISKIVEALFDCACSWSVMEMHITVHAAFPRVGRYTIFTQIYVLCATAFKDGN